MYTMAFSGLVSRPLGRPSSFIRLLARTTRYVLLHAIDARARRVVLTSRVIRDRRGRDL